MIKSLVVVLLLAFSLVLPVHAQEYISHGSFDRVALYRPSGVAKQFVLFLSGESGWDKRMDSAARALTKEGAMVAGIDLPRLRVTLGKAGGDCVLPDGEVLAFEHGRAIAGALNFIGGSAIEGLKAVFRSRYLFVIVVYVLINMAFLRVLPLSACLNGSKTCGRKSGAMPLPVSFTQSRMSPLQPGSTPSSCMAELHR